MSPGLPRRGSLDERHGALLRAMALVGADAGGADERGEHLPLIGRMDRAQGFELVLVVLEHGPVVSFGRSGS
jgi:hypothetical protein